ncbi:MAG: fibronectin type III domain-containing protein, partial [Deinococcus sp.]|nr:fibronectin type III domain-containing protein [Deinococcus sp.]
NEAQAATPSPGTPPLPPANLAATAVSGSQINLSWQDNASDEGGFKLERRTDAASGWVQMGTVGGNVTSYQDTGLVAGTTYFYRVRAYNAQGDSTYSNEAQAATPSPGTPPLPPSRLTATGVSRTRINLSWRDNSTDEGGFRIERISRTTGAWIQVATVGANVSSYRHTRLRPNTTYYYRVLAYNANGDSAYSNEASARTRK